MPFNNFEMKLLLQILEMSVGNIFTLATSVYVFNRLKTRIPYLDTPIFLFIFLYITTLYTFILGLLGFLDPHKIAIISIFGLVILSVSTLKHRGKWTGFLKIPLSYWRNIKISKFGMLLLVLAILQLGRIFFHIWYMIHVN